MDSGTVPAPEVAALAATHLQSIAERAGLTAGPCLSSTPASSVGAPGQAAAPRSTAAPARQAPTPDPAAVLLREAGRATLLRLELIVPDPRVDACPRPARSHASHDERRLDLGLVPVAHLDIDIARAALALRPGETSTPIATRFGTVVVRVLVRVDPTPTARASTPAAATAAHPPVGG